MLGSLDKAAVFVMYSSCIGWEYGLPSQCRVNAEPIHPSKELQVVEAICIREYTVLNTESIRFVLNTVPTLMNMPRNKVSTMAPWSMGPALWDRGMQARILLLLLV